MDVIISEGKRMSKLKIRQELNDVMSQIIETNLESLQEMSEFGVQPFSAIVAQIQPELNDIRDACHENYRQIDIKAKLKKIIYLAAIALSMDDCESNE